MGEGMISQQVSQVLEDNKQLLIECGWLGYDDHRTIFLFIFFFFHAFFLHLQKLRK